MVTFAEALKSLNTDATDATDSGIARQRLNSDMTSNSESTEETGTPKPALELRLRVQARLARIIAEEVAGYQTGVVIKGSTVSLTVGASGIRPRSGSYPRRHGRPSAPSHFDLCFSSASAS